MKMHLSIPTIDNKQFYSLKKAAAKTAVFYFFSMFAISLWIKRPAIFAISFTLFIFM